MPKPVKKWKKGNTPPKIPPGSNPMISKEERRYHRRMEGLAQRGHQIIVEGRTGELYCSCGKYFGTPLKPSTSREIISHGFPADWDRKW